MITVSLLNVKNASPVCLLGLLGLLWLTAVQADVYVYTDANGVRHFTHKEKCQHKSCRFYMAMAKSPRPHASIPHRQLNDHLRQALAKPSGLLPHGVNHEKRRYYHRHIVKVAQQYRLDPLLLHAVVSAESSYNSQAVSHAGAKGLMQLMPATAKRFGVRDVFNPIQNLQGGARYLSWLLNRFKNVRLALAAYNAGEGAVQRYGNTIPPYRETQNYVTKVLDFYRYYRHNGQEG